MSFSSSSFAEDFDVVLDPGLDSDRDLDLDGDLDLDLECTIMISSYVNGFSS
jgi:hypothetical protein